MSLRERLSGAGRAGLQRVHRTYLDAWMGITSRYPIGTNIYDREWDALVVLDTCRVDAMRAVAPEYDFIEDVDTIWSVGSKSSEWVAKTFTYDYIDEIRETVQVSINAYTYNLLVERTKYPPDRWADFGTVYPEDFQYIELGVGAGRKYPDGPSFAAVTTDRAVDVARSHDFGRFIVHYREPHSPYVANALRENRDLREYEQNPFGALGNGTPREVVWEAYLDELRAGLDSVEVLLRNLDAERVVITADHGEMFLRAGVFGHPAGVPLPSVHRVPWVETTAEDTGEYEPSFAAPANPTVDENAKEWLRDLGYL